MNSLQKILGIGLCLVAEGCVTISPSAYYGLTCQVSQLTNQRLVYKDNLEGTTKIIPLQITLLDVKSEGKNYRFLLSGCNNIKAGDEIQLDYLNDKEITIEEILERSYSGICIKKTKQKHKFMADGYIKAWKIINKGNHPK